MGGLGGGGGGGGGQGLGGGFGGGGGGLGGGGGGGFFNVPAEKTRKLKVACVCLEHGKLEPRATMTYELRPLEGFCPDPAVRELCRSLGADSISQRAAQVAAWHLANVMTFEQLRDKEIVHLDGRRESYFSGDELLSGMGLAAQARVRSTAAEAKSDVSHSRTDESAEVSRGAFQRWNDKP